MERAIGISTDSGSVKNKKGAKSDIVIITEYEFLKMAEKKKIGGL